MSCLKISVWCTDLCKLYGLFESELIVALVDFIVLHLHPQFRFRPALASGYFKLRFTGEPVRYILTWWVSTRENLAALQWWPSPSNCPQHYYDVTVWRHGFCSSPANSCCSHVSDNEGAAEDEQKLWRHTVTSCSWRGPCWKKAIHSLCHM